MRLMQSAMYTATFHLVSCVRLPQFFGIRDGSLLIHSIVEQHLILSLKETSFKMMPNLYQKWFEQNPVFVKSSKFCEVWTIRFYSNFTSMWYKYFLNNVWRDLRLPMSASATVTRKSFYVKCTAKIDVPIGYFMLPLLMLTSGA